jgi:hypothetical protein
LGVDLIVTREPVAVARASAEVVDDVREYVNVAVR